MRKILFLVLVVLLSNVVNAQTKNSANGRFVTMSGDLRVLLICVNFGNHNKDTFNDIWHKDSLFPKEILENRLFYTDYSQFKPIATQADSNNISQWYYDMSGGKFRMIIEQARNDEILTAHFFRT